MKPADRPGQSVRQVATISTMGTVVSVDVRTPAPDEQFGTAVEAMTIRLRAIDQAFSPWLSDSWVSRLIDGRVSPGDCPPEVQQVIELSMNLMELTHGYFSPFWRHPEYGSNGPDPTGLVKGWAAQQASDILLSLGMPDHVVNAAGDLVVSGGPGRGADRRPWRVGIPNPFRPQELAGLIELGAAAPRWAVATSGIAELGAHVSDPHSEVFPRSIGSATAVTRLNRINEGGATVDACATALVAAGDGGAAALLEKFPAHGVDALVIEADGTVRDPSSLLARA
jgi:thiamine biosynthesis lipoprotein